tara:strand:- start:32891 stop:33250 length:360 start_codon:yes stop_codon:yes gene_type:complete
MPNHLSFLMGEFNEKLDRLKHDYIGFFDEGSKTELQGLFRDQVQQDVMSLYVTAQKAISQDAEGADAQTLLFGLEEVDVLLANANLSHDNVSHNHTWMRDYLSESLPVLDMSFIHPGND